MPKTHGTRSLSRRHVLQGLGGLAIGLPWLEQFDHVAHAQTTPGHAKRVIVMTYTMGVPMGAWRPSTTGTGFTLPFVTAPLQRFRERCLFVSGIDHHVLDVGGERFTYGHPGKMEAALTGTLTTGGFRSGNTNSLTEVNGARTDGGANGPSVEHVIGQYLRKGHAFPSIDLAVNGDAREYAPPATYDSLFFFEGRANPVAMSSRPYSAMSTIFSGVAPGAAPNEADTALRSLRARNKSVLDAVRSSFNDLKQGLGRDDRRRLEEHAELVRRLEIDTQVSVGCTLPAGVPDGGNYGNSRMDQLAGPTIRVLAHAMACDLAPVGRLDFTNQQNPRFGIPGLDGLLDGYGSKYDWHAMVHGDPLPGTSGALRPGRDGATAYDPNLLAGYRFFVQQFANLLAALDAIEEGPGQTVLDNSLVVLASDLGEGLAHAHMKMGFVLAGNLGGARPGHFDAGPDARFEVTNAYFNTPSRYCVNQLLNSMLDMAGVVDGQGKPVSHGLRGFLESRAMSRRIDALFA